MIILHHPVKMSEIWTHVILELTTTDKLLCLPSGQLPDEL